MLRRVLVGTDGSPTAARAVDQAVAVAATLGASLTIFTAAYPDRGEKTVALEHKRHLGSGVPIDTAVVDADPVPALVFEARNGEYDLLVVGNKGMTGLSRFLRPGSVPGRVSHQLPCSLLIVKTT